MSFEKAIEAIIKPTDLFDAVINFLSIKISNPPNAQLKECLDNIFQFLNNGENKSESLQNRNIEKLSFEFLIVDKDLQNIQKEDCSEVVLDKDSVELPKPLSNIKNTNSKATQKDSFTETLNSKPQKASLTKTNKSFSEYPSINQRFTKEQVELFLNFVKLAKHSFNTRNLIKHSINEPMDKPLQSFNKANKEPLEATIRLNVKLFDRAFAQALKGNFEIFQTRLIEQPPFGIVAFYIKEKDKKTFVKKTRKLRKKRLSKKQVKYKKEDFKENS